MKEVFTSERASLVSNVFVVGGENSRKILT